MIKVEVKVILLPPPQVRPIRKNTNKAGNKQKSLTDKVLNATSKLDKFLRKAHQTVQSTKTGVQMENQDTTQSDSVTRELEAMMDQHQGSEAQVIEVAVVHSMFKRLEDNFEQKMKLMKQEMERNYKMKNPNGSMEEESTTQALGKKILRVGIRVRCDEKGTLQST